jgi:hypothetical protein
MRPLPWDAGSGLQMKPVSSGLAVRGPDDPINSLPISFLGDEGQAQLFGDAPPQRSRAPSAAADVDSVANRATMQLLRHRLLSERCPPRACDG